ncbi:MAG: nitrate reductase [Betaproteobacteria bacterium]|nr:MAG: nitrate reductase [Betaproteobacteria bacterium]
MAETRSTCCYCGVGCGLVIETDGARIVGVRGDPSHPANFGRLCTKGSTLHLTATLAGRALQPELRRSRSLSRAPVSWDAALDHAAERFADIIRAHGPDAVAFYISGQLLTEDYYVFNKLAKGLVGTNNIDSNSRLCMSSAVAGYKQTLGADAPPACYEDIDHADCILIWGANPVYAHPIVFRRIEDAKARNPQVRIVVVDPRRTDTAAAADLHLANLPGTDLILLGAFLNVLLLDARVDLDYVRAHTEGFEALRDAVRELTPSVASQLCGVPERDIVAAARWFGEARAALSLWCQGLNQSTHGTHNTAALVHLHLATGQIGRPGAGPLSLTGQPNAMGGREVGGMANLLSGHRDLASAEDRAWVARFWGVDSVPERPGRTAVEMFDALAGGEIKAVWIACTNPAQSMPQQSRIRAALERSELVVVQDAFGTTETAAFADLLLPAATWGEKEGTVTNSERRISRVRKAVEPPGAARADWRIACDFALRLGPRLGKDAQQLFPYVSPEQIFAEHAQTTRGRDLDISALDYAILDCDGPQQWPYRAGAGVKRLYGDGRFATPSGRARFVKIDLRTVAEAIDAHYPLRLTTGRLRDQWHGMSRTGRSARLFGHAPEPVLHMHADDMSRRGMYDGDLARISSRRGAVVLPVAGSAQIARGQAFAPMHFGARHLSHAGANELTLSAFDPISKQPELKHAAIEVEKVLLGHRLVAVRRAGGEHDPAEQVLAWLHRVQPLLAVFAYAYAGLLGRDRPAIALRIAHEQPLSSAQLEAIDVALDLPDGMCLSYNDVRRGISKRALLAEGSLLGFRLSGDVGAAGWLTDALLDAQPAEQLRRWMLGPFATPPLATPVRGRGRIVCSCVDVPEHEITRRIAGGARLEELLAELRCGTTCGSCLPELRRMLGEAKAGAGPESYVTR